jgi:chemotaxis family two-component system sensor histidine kinase/response regulator PixL
MPDSPVTSSLLSLGERWPRRRGRVLVVDDDDAVRMSVTRNLQEAGFAIVEARNGREGLRLLRSDSSVCVVLLDLTMPGIDGWQFRREQVADARLAGVPTIILSGNPLHEIDHQQLQAADYLLKPVGREHLVSVVAHYCEPVRT